MTTCIDKQLTIKGLESYIKDQLEDSRYVQKSPKRGNRKMTRLEDLKFNRRAESKSRDAKKRRVV